MTIPQLGGTEEDTTRAHHKADRSQPNVWVIILAVALVLTLLTSGYLVLKTSNQSGDITLMENQITTLESDLADTNDELDTTESDLSEAQGDLSDANELIGTYKTCTEGLLKALGSALDAVGTSSLGSILPLIRGTNQLEQVDEECKEAARQTNGGGSVSS